MGYSLQVHKTRPALMSAQGPGLSDQLNVGDARAHSPESGLDGGLLGGFSLADTRPHDHLDGEDASSDSPESHPLGSGSSIICWTAIVLWTPSRMLCWMWAMLVPTLLNQDSTGFCWETVVSWTPGCMISWLCVMLVPILLDPILLDRGLVIICWTAIVTWTPGCMIGWPEGLGRHPRLSLLKGAGEGARCKALQLVRDVSRATELHAWRLDGLDVQHGWPMRRCCLCMRDQSSQTRL